MAINGISYRKSSYGFGWGGASGVEEGGGEGLPGGAEGEGGEEGEAGEGNSLMVTVRRLEVTSVTTTFSQLGANWGRQLGSPSTGTLWGPPAGAELAEAGPPAGAALAEAGQPTGAELAEVGQLVGAELAEAGQPTGVELAGAGHPAGVELAVLSEAAWRFCSRRRLRRVLLFPSRERSRASSSSSSSSSEEWEEPEEREGEEGRKGVEEAGLAEETDGAGALSASFPAF